MNTYTQRPKQHALYFMTDGYSTIGESKSDIIKACSDLKDNLVSACFVEYSMYADHDMLQQMAEEVGGSLVQATDFSKYAFELDNMKNMSFGKRIQVAVPNLSAGFEFIVGHNETGFVVAKPLDSKVSLPSNCKSYSYFDGSGDIQTVQDDVAACAVVAALIQRGQADTAVELAAKIGDVDLYRTIENSFSKQDYVKVVEQAKELAIGNKSLFGTAPKSTSLVQDPNAYCVLELLMDLADVEGNELVLSHSEFDYHAIGQKRTAIEINGFTPKFTDASSEISARIANLTFDGERPNVSILVKRTGTVSLPENNFGLGTEVQSYIWRNYSIIKDGIVNVSKLPVKLTYASYTKLVSRGLKLAPFKIGEVYVIDVAALPVINRSMVTGVTAQWLFNTSFLEYSLESQQKYIKTLIDKPEVGAKFAAMYGEEAALFLKEYGITEGGFSPKTAAAEETDKYVAKVLTVKMAGMSSVPKVSDVQAAIAKGKALTPSQQVMCEAIDTIETSVFEPEVLLDKTKSALKELRRDLVKAKFGVIIGRKWFSDLAGYDDTVREMDFGLSKNIKCEVVMSDKLV